MGNRAFTISFVVAALAVSMVFSYVSSTEEAIRAQYGTETSVVVAKKNIKELDILDETNLTIKSIPRSFRQPGTSQKIADFKGALAIAPIISGEQITRSKVTQLGARTGLARQVAIGKRAVSIKVSDESAVAKLIKPGDRVDVLAVIDPTGSGNKLFYEGRTVLQDVLVLATGKYVTNTVPGILETDPYKKDNKNKINLSEYTQFANVTLEVDPFQAQMLVYSTKIGDGVYLTLRNNDDNTKEELQKTMLRDLMGKDGLSFQAPQGRAPGNAGPPAFGNK
ncbi:MAG: Flp pilus assembly protein CpaB [Oligoflexia bacterium]|nr:Flp pilus assembly protein CpaB [Oligoflexia bacterium]